MSDRLSLDVWLDGHPLPVGKLVSFERGDIGYRYNAEYLGRGARPISMSLPLQEAAFGDLGTRAFFANLLPENDQVQRFRERNGLEAGDVVGLLYHLGADCPGAISCLPVGVGPAKVPGVLSEDYLPLSAEEIAEIMVELADNRRLPSTTQDPSPLAGVQGKIALTVLPDGRWALPRPDSKVPTTHILKVPRNDDAGDVPLETAACTLASNIGINASVPKPVSHGNRQGLLITRFDRDVKNGIVYRIHQEDFTQAMGLPTSAKYERHGRAGQRFDAEAVVALLNRTAQPALARETFLLWTIFNLAVGNTDNHGKNHALLYSGADVPYLAPLYDILPIRLDEKYTHEFAYNIGAAKFAADLTSEDFEQLFSTFGLSKTAQNRFINRRIAPILARLDKASETLKEKGLKAFDDFIGAEIERLAEILGQKIAVRERDYFAARGGGWLAGS
jgi:serine/threonine-protein kinase HipA